MVIERGKTLTDLGDKNDVVFGLADAATAVLANESEPSHACRTHFSMTAPPVRNPFQSIGTHRAAIVHLLLIKT